MQPEELKIEKSSLQTHMVRKVVNKDDDLHQNGIGRLMSCVRKEVVAALVSLSLAAVDDGRGGKVLSSSFSTTVDDGGGKAASGGGVPLLGDDLAWANCRERERLRVMKLCVCEYELRV
ncbi:hypothetical protein Dimus_008082 [Dionaea muscipula]